MGKIKKGEQDSTMALPVKHELSVIKIGQILTRYPFAATFFENNGIPADSNKEKSLDEYFSTIDETYKEDMAISQEHFTGQLEEYITQMLSFLGDTGTKVDSLTILPGHGKTGEPENFSHLTIKKNEIISIVGPTGSGKSRLLADIEWAAQNDTPTGRSILINNEQPDQKWRYSSSEKLVAQLSQNMNFVMDLSVHEFLELHAESRMISDRKNIIMKIIDQANHLSGETFDTETPITALSGGQSRALMIADTAILSSSPIILIDEIENAGIDRKKALELLISEGKIVLIATHDPILALMGNRRIVIKNGGIEKIIENTDDERSILTEIEIMDKKIQSLRRKLRNGEHLTTID